jgi:hypothetical protein
VGDLEKLVYGDYLHAITGSDGVNVLVPGDVFAIHTNAGTYVKALVAAEFDPTHNHGLVFQWVT